MVMADERFEFDVVYIYFVTGQDQPACPSVSVPRVCMFVFHSSALFRLALNNVCIHEWINRDVQDYSWHLVTAVLNRILMKLKANELNRIRLDCAMLPGVEAWERQISRKPPQHVWLPVQLSHIFNRFRTYVISVLQEEYGSDFRRVK